MKKSRSKWRPTRTQSSWLQLRTRCNNPNNPYYHVYGGKGITYDISWDSFDNFLKDMGERPEGTSIDRIDNTKGYSKENCRWATPTQQSLNRGPMRKKSNYPQGVKKLRSGRWGATTSMKGKSIYLGTFDSAEEAHGKYVEFINERKKTELNQVAS